MKILIIYPHGLDKGVSDPERMIVPSGVYYLGATLKSKGYDVEILNGHELQADQSPIRRLIEEKKPDVVGFSILNFNRWAAIEIAAIVKKVNPGTPVVFGGITATVLWRHFLKHFHDVDYIVLQEGEYRFLQLVRFLENPPGPYPEAIEGIAFRKNGVPFCIPASGCTTDIDALPDPAQYFDFSVVATSRGCPNRCSFCGSPAFWKGRVQFHSPTYVVGQLERLRAKGQRFLAVGDDTFSLNKRRTIEICRRIVDRKLDIAWQAMSRVDCVDEQVLRWMRKAGCYMLCFGVESGSEAMRSQYRKYVGDAQIERAFDLTRRHGIIPLAFFIYAGPGETEETITQSIDLMLRIKPLQISTAPLQLYPGTQLCQRYMDEHGRDDDIWLGRFEAIWYCQTDPDLRHKGAAFGTCLTNAFLRSLPATIENMELIDDPEMYPLHADFLFRLEYLLANGFNIYKSLPDRLVIAKACHQRAQSYALPRETQN